MSAPAFRGQLDILIDRNLAIHWGGLGALAAMLLQAPIIGYWPAGLAANLSAHLARAEDRSVHRWAASVGAHAIDAGGDLPNINRASDLVRLANAAHG